MKNITLNTFNKNKEMYELKKSSSLFGYTNFLTQQGNDLTCEQIDYFTNIINREESLTKIMYEIKDIEKAICIEASIFEFSIVYTYIKNIDQNLVSAIYKDKLNDILENLNNKSDIKNETLKKNILNNEFNAQDIAFLTPQQIHPKRWETQIRKKELREHKKNNMAATDLYECYKCHKRKCSVLQMQIRSADEPITNIVTCLNCYHVWRC